MTLWFRFDWNVQHYFVSIRKTFIDIFVTLTELRKKKIITHIVPQKKTHKILFSHVKATQYFLYTKKTTQNFTCTSPEYSTIASSWMLKFNSSAVVVVVAEKMWISQNMLWLPSSGHMSRLQCMKREEKNPTFLSAGRKYDLRFVKKLCTHVQVLCVVAIVKDERQGCNLSYCWQQLLLSSDEL